MTFFKLILKRIFQQFRRGILFWVIGPAVIILVLLLGQLLAVYLECWAFGQVTYFIRSVGPRSKICSSARKLSSSAGVMPKQ
jgi:hypothetical protein